MPVLQLSSEQIYALVDEMDFESKTQLFERLKPQVLSKRWQELFARIDRRLQADPISDDEIAQEIEKAREEFYAHRR